MQRYIFEEIKKVKDQVSFSMPGHKSKDIFDFDFSYDMTETLTTDNLLEPKTIIKKSQEELAKAYGVKSSYYIENGSTSAIHIALSLVTRPGDRVLIQRNSHISVYNALILNRLEADYIYPNYDDKKNILTGIFLKDLENKLKENDFKALVLTSPNYFGLCLDLEKISKLAHKYKVRLIVDEAHGAHLKFSDYEKYSAINYADIIIHSTHKTLPSLTQSALLHINFDLEKEKVLRMMKVYLSSSPSYLFMMSSEFAVDFMIRKGRNIIKQNLSHIENLKESLKNVNFYKKDDTDPTVACLDPSKILFSIDGYTGADIVKSLFLSYNIRLEMGDLYYALALSSVANDEKDFEALGSALSKFKKKDPIAIKKIYIEEAKKNLSLCDAFYAKSKNLKLDQAKNHTSASMVTVYPPGVPILVPGEIISGDIIDQIRQYQKEDLEVIGLNNEDMIEVVE
ncbi:aminotransferase class I/II-fold pyridoxal phosphate-dependent enzyme [Peptoniphilus obesi]|uniref:aminotransferase class I/II-fold pyridoxal phosphate-dependent enzyme n=1 Tax=Peptoniphilus obesi TaxID=1472765 RepID=UPI0004AD8AF6|nr:aminotransferase class I/II-fold pyridoxal phosphate-dependent enzyme [Peptoniphilus obesi]